MHWEENPPALDQGHGRVLIIIPVGPIILFVIYVKSGMGTSCPVLDVTMCTVSFSSMLSPLGANMSSPGFVAYPGHRSSIK